MLEGIFSTTLVFLVLGSLIVLILCFFTIEIIEVFSNALQLRAKGLKKAIQELLFSDELADEIYRSPSIQSLYRRPKKAGKEPEYPVYIPAYQFADALFDHFVPLESLDEPKDAIQDLEVDHEADLMRRFKLGLKKEKKNPKLVRLLTSLLVEAEFAARRGANLHQALLAGLERWFDNAMRQMTAAYKRTIQVFAFLSGLILAIALNIDAIRIVSSLWYQATFPQRQAMFDTTLTHLENNQANVDMVQNMALAELDNNSAGLSLPFGWTFVRADPNGKPCSSLLSVAAVTTGITAGTPLQAILCGTVTNMPVDQVGWISKLIGFLLTAFITSAGAPILFDLLQKLVDIRSIERERSIMPDAGS